MAFGIFLGIVMMGGVIFLALSRKSEFKVRLAALGALALMIVSVIICLVVYFKAASVPKQLFLPDMLPSDMPAPVKNNPVTMIMLGVFMVVLFLVVVFLALREQRRAEGKEEPPVDGW